MKKFDSSLLQFIPKGSYYNTQNEQLKEMERTWEDFFNYDREIFALSSLLPGTAYSKGRMTHFLLSNPLKNEGLVEYGISGDYETEIIKWNLENENMAKSLKNLLMLTGEGVDKRVNNARTKKIILDFIFNRDNDSLETLVLKFKTKVSKLVRHALGHQDLTKALNGDSKALKKITKYNKDSEPILYFLFGKKYSGRIHFDKIATYYDASKFARENNVEKFIECAKKNILPQEILMGFRNTYKLDVDLSTIYEFGKMSEKQKIQNVNASKKAGKKINIDYTKHDIYDLWKLFYLNIMNREIEENDKIAKAIAYQSQNKLEVELGNVVIIFDVSKSMEGSEIRPWHPFLTGISLISKLDNIKKIIYAGGNKIRTGIDSIQSVIIPSGATELWKALVEAVELEPKTILVISDGYENTIKGTFNAVYEKLKAKKEFNLLHVNPVYASEASGARSLVKDIKPMVIDNYKYLKTNVIFELITSDRNLVKKMLISEFKNLVHEGV